MKPSIFIKNNINNIKIFKLKIMKKFLFIMAAICLLASSSQVSAQLIIRNNGHAEIGVNPDENDPDTATVLKIFGDKVNHRAGGRITFGDSAYVSVGEYGITNTNRLWLHGKEGLHVTSSANAADTIIFYDASSPGHVLLVGPDVQTGRMLIQSDERYKENIEPVGDMLEVLKSLEPVTYNLKSRSKNPPKMDADGSERYGFLAQNVKEVFPELVYTDDRGYMSVDYIGLIPILVQSINELRAELAEVKDEKQLETTNDAFAAQSAGQGELEASLRDAKLYQNAPNPWSSETVIRYSLPQSVSSAMIYVYDMQGAQLKSIPAQGRGESQVTLTARDLKAGMYIYALVADGKLVDSKQMILTK